MPDARPESIPQPPTTGQRRPRPRRLIENLHQDMTVGALVDVLEHLRFVDGRAVLQLDHDVRDFIVAALRRR